MQKSLFALSLGIGTLMLTALAHSSPQQLGCAERTKLIESLTKQYGETRRSYGLGNDNGLIELFASDDTGTWTILMTTPGGRTCMMAAGNSFGSMEPQQGEPT